MSDELLVDIDDAGVMLITFNRPEAMNSLNAAVGDGLLAALERASRDDDVRSVVITGNGRAFCAGAQVTEESDPSRGGGPRSRHSRLDYVGSSGATVEAFARCDVPVLAAINGATAGAGFGIALCCDVRFAAESARIGPIFIRRGLSTDYGTSYWLPRIVGLARAYEILYDGSLVEAERALQLGLVNRVLPDSNLLEETMTFAHHIANGPPLANTQMRRLLVRSLDAQRGELSEGEWRAQVELLGTADAREGFTAFLEQRAPSFSGE